MALHILSAIIFQLPQVAPMANPQSTLFKTMDGSCAHLVPYFITLKGTIG